jgi:EmrB/QacA subfamily drug resistance transporter
MGLPCDEGVLVSSRTNANCSPGSAPWILAATILGSSLAFIDGTVVNLALPALQANLGATVTAMQWVVESYALLLTSFMLVGGSLGDIYGRKRIFIAGVVVFSAASMWCGLASSVSVLIAARCLQGIGGALLVPGSLAILGASFQESERGKAIGTWSGFTSITSAAGPVLGGFLIEHASWRWVFFLNLPVALAVLAITIWHVPESRNEKAADKLDWPGALLASIGLGGLVYALVESAKQPWSDPVLIAAALVGLTALVAFIAVEYNSSVPLLPLGLFRSRTFSGVNLLTLFLYGALSGLLFFLPLNLIQVQGYSATSAGGAMLPFILLMFLLSRWSGGLVDRYGARRPLVVGPIIVAAGFALFALPGIGGGYWTTYFPAVMVLGVGMAVSVAPLTTTVMNSVPVEHAGTVSGINNAVSRLAGLLAVAVLGVVMLAVFNRNLASGLVRLDLDSETRLKIESQREKLAAIHVPDPIESEKRAEIEKSIDESFLAGFRIVMLSASVLSLLSAGAAWISIKGTQNPHATTSASETSPLPAP